MNPKVWWFLLHLFYANGTEATRVYEFPSEVLCAEVRETLAQGCRIGDVIGVEAEPCRIRE